MSSFGDAEPEDAWDAGDPPDVKTANLLRRLEALEAANEPLGWALLGSGQLVETLEAIDAKARRTRILVGDVAELAATLEAGHG